MKERTKKFLIRVLDECLSSTEFVMMFSLEEGILIEEARKKIEELKEEVIRLIKEKVVFT